MWYVNFTERQDRCDLWIYKPHEVWFASWGVQMFFFQLLKTSRFPLNLIHKKRYLKFSLLNLWPLKFCLKYLHDVWTFLKFEHETESAFSNHLRKCIENNMENMHTDVREQKVNSRNFLVWLFFTIETFTVQSNFKWVYYALDFLWCSSFRAAVPPFSSARSVLEKLKVNEEERMSKVILMPLKYIMWEI